MKKHKLIIFVKLLALFSLIFFTYIHFSYAANADVIIKVGTAFKTIKIWLFSISTPAAAVSITVGLFMKKFSFGDEEKMRTAKKIIRGTFISYGLIILLDLILSAVESLLV